MNGNHAELHGTAAWGRGPQQSPAWKELTLLLGHK